MESTNALKNGWRQRSRYMGVFLALIAALLFITVLNINIGSVPISVSQIAEILFTGNGDPTQVAIVWKIRLPRILMAALLGGAVFCMGCDLIARTAFAPMELNISTVTAVFGAPVVIAMLMRRHKER